MSADSDKPSRQHVIGEELQAAMAKRGCELTLEESRQFAITLIDLIAAGLIVPIDPLPSQADDVAT